MGGRSWEFHSGFERSVSLFLRWLLRTRVLYNWLFGSLDPWRAVSQGKGGWSNFTCSCSHEKGRMSHS